MIAAQQPQTSQNDRYNELVRKCWIDSDFKTRLIADPVTVLREEGWVVPDGIQVQVVESTQSVQYLALPYLPAIPEVDLPRSLFDRVQGRDVYGQDDETHVTACTPTDTGSCCAPDPGPGCPLNTSGGNPWESPEPSPTSD